MSYVIFRQAFTRPALKHEYRRPDSMFIQDRGGLVKIVPHNMDRFEHLLAPTLLRIGEEVLDLPPFTASARYCMLEEDAERAYRDLEADFITELEAGTVTAGNALVRILRLQQICAGQTRTDDGLDAEVSQAKEKLLTDLLTDLPVDEPLAVFGHFHHDLDVIHRVAKETGRRSLELSGRRNELAAWQAGDDAPQVLAVQDQAGSLGVSLVRARYMVYYTLPNSLVLADQSKARLLRPGQTRPVSCISLICKGTVDEEIEHAVAARTEVVNAIIAAIARRHR